MTTAIRYQTIEDVAMEARPYPDHLLADCETGLVLFAAAFEGHNDAIHFALAGIRGYCVDVDTPKLTRMASLYPRTWQWGFDDAWKFADAARELGESWDVVSCDTWTGDLMHRSLESLDLWCSIANRVVTVTITDDVDEIALPEGWTSSLYPRSDHVSWLVLERE